MLNNKVVVQLRLAAKLGTPRRAALIRPFGPPSPKGRFWMGTVN